MNDHTLQIWWACLSDFSGLFDRLTTQLPNEERERTDRFRVDVARHRFVLARTVLRRQLGASLGANPRELIFATGDRGKPYLASPEIDTSPQFNLSHSGDVVTLAIAWVDVGVDIEDLREILKAERMARRFFSPDELSTINTLAGTPRDHAFLRIWTQKEAYLKATGLGVGMPLRDVETEPDPSKPPRLRAIAGDRGEAARWALLDVKVPGAVCTVAVRGTAPENRVRRFTPANLATP